MIEEEGTGAKGAAESGPLGPHLHSNGAASAGNNSTAPRDLNHVGKGAAQSYQDTQEGPVLLLGVENNQASKDFRTRVRVHKTAK